MPLDFNFHQHIYKAQCKKQDEAMNQTILWSKSRGDRGVTSLFPKRFRLFLLSGNRMALNWK